MGVTLREKPISNGRISLYLDYYPPIVDPKTGKETRREFLKLYLHSKPRSIEQREENKKIMGFANQIRAEREIELRSRELGIKVKRVLNVDFMAYYEKLVRQKQKEAGKSVHANWTASLYYLKQYFGEKFLTSQFNENKLIGYKNYLLNAKSQRIEDKALGRNTAVKYYNFFTKALAQGFRDQIFGENLAEKITPIKEAPTRREYLSETELKTLWNTDIKNESVKHMAFFSVYTGLRFSDISSLRWDQIYNDEHHGNYLSIKEQKTGNTYNCPISNTAYELLLKQDRSTDLVFNGISYHKVTRYVKEWIKEAEINKSISFHNFRHTYATLQLSHGTDLYTISKLLGHKNVATTQIYTKVLDKAKIEAANRINLNLDND